MRTRPLAGTVVVVLCATAAWAQLDPADEVFYHFMPIAWRDSNNDTYRFGDFGGMTASLDYLEDLGVTAVWMNPIFPSPAYHGYQHGPANEVNAWFGTEAAFLDFVEQAHARGIKVFVDLVCYGISHNSIWFQSAYGNPSSPYDDWLAFTNSANTEYKGSVYSTWNGASVGFIHWNLNNPNPVALVTQWSQHWLDPNNDGDPSDGIDGYRLDHVWEYYPDGPNGWGYNTDDFWVPWKQALQTVNPDVFTFAEQADWGIYGVPLLAAHDATMTKPFEFAARDALANESASPLYNEMAAALAQVPGGRTFVAIIGDHDVDRLTSVIGGSLTKAKAAAAILLTQPFPPIIYFGDEIGMLGVKGNYGSDANDIPMREPFKWNAVAGPPMSNYWILNSQAYNNRYSQDNDGRSVEEQDGVAGSLLEEYKLLIATRKTHVALRHGSYHAVPASSSRIWSFLRHAAAQETLLVAINVYGSSRTTNLDLSSVTIPGGSTPVQDIISGQYLTNLTDANKAAYSITIPAYGYKILTLNVVPGSPPANTIDGLDITDDFDPTDLVATQDNATGLGDNLSELDQFFVHAEPTGLRIGLTGNLQNNGTGLCLFFDTIAGGQNTLRIEGFAGPPDTPLYLTGLQFDAGFAPDEFLFLNAYSSSLYVDQITLTPSGTTPKVYRGASVINGGSGVLSGGQSNPNGLQAALNNSNTAGVTSTSAAGAATATSGFELLVPYADIGLPVQPLAQTIRLVAFLVQQDGNVSNQWLRGLGGGYANLGQDPDLTSIPGNQFVTLAPGGCVGDCNCDGAVTFDDIKYFVVALGGEQAWITHHLAQNGAPPTCPYANCDASGAGGVTFDDIKPFVALLGTPCP